MSSCPTMGSSRLLPIRKPPWMLAQAQTCTRKRVKGDTPKPREHPFPLLSERAIKPTGGKGDFCLREA